MPPSGDQASVLIPCLAWNSRSGRCVKNGWSSTWFTAGTTSVCCIRFSRCRSAKFDYADRASACFGVHFLDRLVRRDRRIEVGRDGVVQQEQVYVVEAEAPEAALEADESFVVAV